MKVWIKLQGVRLTYFRIAQLKAYNFMSNTFHINSSFLVCVLFLCKIQLIKILYSLHFKLIIIFPFLSLILLGVPRVWRRQVRPTGSPVPLHQRYDLQPGNFQLWLVVQRGLRQSYIFLRVCPPLSTVFFDCGPFSVESERFFIHLIIFIYLDLYTEACLR